ncbi:hypothetical protein BRD56_11630 [Thermoplasmatales archaeon SW_10_69_26]|nr:MAG: hypothetical protein BRD56_11630 [Thermoplasmatales archaeon SW_10_69_26]
MSELILPQLTQLLLDPFRSISAGDSVFTHSQMFPAVEISEGSTALLLYFQFILPFLMMLTVAVELG